MNKEDGIETNNQLFSCNSEDQSSFADRLRSLMQGMSENAFAQKCKLPLSSVRKYFAGSIPSIDKAVQIARENDVSLKWLATGETDGGKGEFIAPGFNDEFALIPGYRVQVSAGHGAIAPDGEEPCRYLAFRRKWLKWRGFSEKDLVIVWCKGDSMEPIIYNNDTLVVHTGQTKPVDGGVYVLRNHDQLWVKRIQSLPNAWVLLSDNPRYPPIEVSKDEQHNFQVVGKVVHISHDLD